MKFDMLAQRLVNEPWAITRPALEAMCGYLESRIRGEAPDIAEVAKALGGRSSGGDMPEQPYQLIDNVAVVEMTGTIVKRASFCYTSAADIRSAVEAALDDPMARAVLLSVDSPGGTVDGTKELADFMAEAAARKPLFAYADGLMCSAAYWIATAAREIAAPATATVGSIGVLSVHHDFSRAYDKAGFTKSFITYGAFKAAGNDAEPLGDPSRGYLQERVDQLGELFVAAVAANRSLSPDAVRGTEAKVFLAGPAVEAGLIDRIVPDLSAFINHITEVLSMSLTMDKLRAEHPALVEQIEAGAMAGAKDATDKAVAEAVSGERKRLVGLYGAINGEDAAKAFAGLAESGTTPEAMTAAKALLGGSQARDASGQFLNALHQAHENKGVGPVGADAGKPKTPEFMALVEQRKKETGCTTAQAMSWASAGYPEAHEAYLKGKGGK